MADSPTIVTINGTDYYCPSDYVDNLIVVNGYLINTGSQTIYLYGDFREYNNSYSGYPRITCQANYNAYITQSYNTTSQTLSIQSFEVKNRSFNDIFLIGVIIVGLLGMILFKKR